MDQLFNIGVIRQTFHSRKNFCILWQSCHWNNYNFSWFVFDGCD